MCLGGASSGKVFGYRTLVGEFGGLNVVLLGQFPILHNFGAKRICFSPTVYGLGVDMPHLIHAGLSAAIGLLKLKTEGLNFAT